MAKKRVFFGFFDPYFRPPKNPIFSVFLGFFRGFLTPRKSPPKPPIRGLRDFPPRPDRVSRVSHLLISGGELAQRLTHLEQIEWNTVEYFSGEEFFIIIIILLL